jgi:hypothetical protein
MRENYGILCQLFATQAIVLSSHEIIRTFSLMKGLRLGARVLLQFSVVLQVLYKKLFLTH